MIGFVCNFVVFIGLLLVNVGWVVYVFILFVVFGVFVIFVFIGLMLLCVFDNV